jgi:hypothetical protein
MDFANEVKQSFMAFRKAHDSQFIWHSDCFWEIASSLRSSQNPFSRFKIRLKPHLFILPPYLPTQLTHPLTSLISSFFQSVTSYGLRVTSSRPFGLLLFSLHFCLLPFAFCLFFSLLPYSPYLQHY